MNLTFKMKTFTKLIKVHQPTFLPVLMFHLSYSRSVVNIRQIAGHKTVTSCKG